MNTTKTRLTFAVALTAALMSAQVFAQDLGLKSVGSVQKKNGPMQVTVAFTKPVDPTTAGNVANYDLGAGITINSATMMIGLPAEGEAGNGEGSLRGRIVDNQCVVLEVTGLSGTASKTLTATGITANSGAETFTGSMNFVPSGYLWAEVATLYSTPSPGHREGKVIADSDNGFDIFNNGRTGWGNEDEFTFVYRELDGDFDFKSRIEFQDYSSRWARAGIMVREFVDDGTAEGCFGRYVTSHTDPVRAFTSNDAGEVAGTRAGNNTYESNYRMNHFRATSPGCGDGTHTAFGNDTQGNGGGTPEYPQAWLRLVRQGDIITAYYSNTGQEDDWQGAWVRDYSTSDNGPLPTRMYLGPMYCAEWGNINPLNVGAQSRYYLTQHRWGPLTTAYVVSITGSAVGFTAQIRDTVAKMNPATLKLWLDGVSVTPTSITGPDATGLTVVNYTSSTILALGDHTVKVEFMDDNVPPLTITKSQTFNLNYQTIPPEYATTTFSSQNAMMVSVHKMPSGTTRGLGDNSVPAYETELQDGFIDPDTGLPVVSEVDTTPAEFLGVLNSTVSPADAGWFNASNPDPSGQVPDSWMPQFVDGNNYALQLYGYAQMAVGVYNMNVNSDDGFKLSFGPNAMDVMGLEAGRANPMARGMTLNGDDPSGFEFVVTAAGVYPFRLIFGQGGGDASIEWYVRNSAGTRVLVNDTGSPVRTYSTGRGRAYVKKFLPYPGSQGVADNVALDIQVVNDLTTVVDDSVKLMLDGADVSSSLSKVRNGATLTVKYTPPAPYAFTSRHQGEFIYQESNGLWRTNAVDFTVKGFAAADLPANSFWIEMEDFDYGNGQSLPSASVMPYAGGEYDGSLLPTRAVYNVDYWRRDRGPLNGAALGGYVYRTDIPGWVTEPTVTDYFVPMGANTGGVNSERPGSPVFAVTANYKSGWSGGGWYNYTRTLPQGIYGAFLVASHWENAAPADGQINSRLAKVVSGVGTTTQTLQELGTFYAPGNGTANSFTPLKTSSGDIAAFKASGNTTLRLTIDAGDTDYIALAPVQGVAPKITSSYPAANAQIARDDTIRVTIEDFSTSVVLNSVKLFLDGVDVTAQATVTKPADITTITFDPAGLMAVGAHTYRVDFNDSASNPFSSTVNFTVVPLGVPGQFLIEAEDFNNAGQAVAAASTMPYLGDAYNGLPAVFDVDYRSAETLTSADGWTPVYRTGAPVTATTTAPLNDNLGGTLGRMRGATWQMNVNYKIGWTGGGDWMNYTRNIPAGYYEVWAALSHGDAPTSASRITASLDLVTGDVSQPDAQQTKTPLGIFNAPPTGGWGANALIPMVDTAGGPVKVVNLPAPPTTLRFSPSSGDFDYFVLFPSSAPPELPTVGAASNPSGQVVITFTDKLYAADSVAGPYVEVVGATSPYPVTGGGAMKYYRAGR